MIYWKKFVLLFSSIFCLLLATNTLAQKPSPISQNNLDQTTTNSTLSKLTQASDSTRSSIFPAINADGTKTVFNSDSDLLNQGIPDNQNEIWLYDSNTASLQRITTASDNGRDSMQPSISGDGTKIAFSSNSDFLNQGLSHVEVWLYDTTNQSFTRVTNSSDPTRNSSRPHISSDGNWIVFESDGDFLNQGIPDGQTEVWLYNVQTSGLMRLTTASAADRSSVQPRVNADGSKVVFAGDSDFLGQGVPFDQPEVWLLDIGSMNLTRITTASESGRVSYAPDIDDSGTNIVFQSNSDFLNEGIVSGQMEVWRYETGLGKLFRVTTASPALIPIGDSTAPRISGNGRFIIFESANDFTGQNRMGT
ncbi:MAG: PD40 domain-containing protein, partial [Anaerolineales bacterium]|nr:PD40 domain-containing protein [Anaerolineales bacterium]